MRYKFRPVCCWLLALCLGGLATVAQGQQLSQDTAKQQPQTAPSAPNEEENPPTAVVIDGRPILLISAPIGGSTAAERVAVIRQRLIDLANSRDVPIDSVQVKERDAWSEIRSGNDLIMTVTEPDAQAAGRVRQQLAAEHAEIIRRTVQRYRNEHTWRNLLRGLLYTALATLVFVGLLWTLWRIRRVARARVEGWLGARVSRPEAPTGLRLSATYLWRPLLALGTFLRWAVIVVLFQAYITAVLRFFPQTQRASLKTTDWVFSQLASVGSAVVDYLPNLLLVIVIGAITYSVLKAESRIFGDIEAERLKISGFYPDWARPTANT